MAITTNFSQFTTLATEVSRHPTIAYSATSGVLDNYFALLDQNVNLIFNWAEGQAPSEVSFLAVYPSAVRVTNLGPN